MKNGFIRNNDTKLSGERFPLAWAFSCAWAGIRYAFSSQRNMKIHGAIAVAVILAGFVFQIDAASWMAIVICITVVFAAECLNTSIEAAIDLVTDEYAELARIAKDCAAGAVYLTALGSVIIGLIIFLPRLFALILSQS